MADAAFHDTAQGLLLVLVMSMLAGFFFLFLPAVLQDGDTGWHLGAGRYIWQTFSIPEADPFSYTFQGSPWTAHEWLAEVLMHGAFSLGGWSALVALYAIIFAATIGVFASYVSRWLSLWGSVAMSILLMAMLAPMLLARPHVFGWFFLIVWMIGLLEARRQNRSPSLALAGVMLVWANAHGSFVSGLLLAGVFGLEALIAAKPGARLQVIRQWGLFGLVSGVAACLTPFGIHGLYFPLMVSTMESLPMIAEWRATDFEEDSRFFVIVLLGLFVALVRPLRLPPLRALLISFFLYMAFAHLRHQAIFALVTLMIVAEPLAAAYRRAHVDARLPLGQRILADWRAHAPLLAVSAVLATGLLGWRLAVPLERPESAGAPLAAIAAIPAELRRQPVFNEYSFGGALIHAGIPVFIDGRADMYGDVWMRDYEAITDDADAAKWHAANKKWRFQWAMLPPKRALTRWLDRQPDWTRFYADKTAVIFVRRDVAARLKQVAPARP